MHKIYPVAVSFFIIIAVQSCSKKTYPAAPAVVHTDINSDTSIIVKKNDDSLVALKPVIKRKPKESIPKVIVVNDKYAKRSVDGRYYYDLQGRRYWRNNKDGKYYLFNKSMLTDDAFKKPN
jgi:hypothetical protein